MPSNFIVDKEFLSEEGTWRITGHIEPGGDLPTHSFLYINDEGELGSFYSVCTSETLQRPKFSEGMSSFGARFVRHDELITSRLTEEEADAFISSITSRLHSLDMELSSITNTTTTYVIGD